MIGRRQQTKVTRQSILATPAGVMGFPETGIGIYPGLGGMLRFARHVGPELTKYYVFTGDMIDAKTAHEMGVFTKVVAPSEIPGAIWAAWLQTAIRTSINSGRFPPGLRRLSRCQAENVEKILVGEPPVGVPEKLAARIVKLCGYKAPLALKIANEIIDQQAGLSIEESVAVRGAAGGGFFHGRCLGRTLLGGSKRPVL